MTMMTDSWRLSSPDATTLDANLARSAPEPIAPAARAEVTVTMLLDALAPLRSVALHTWAAPRD